MKQLQEKIIQCKECPRHTNRQLRNPFLGCGLLSAKIIFVGETPGEQTRQQNGITFCGNKSGDYFLECAADYQFNFSNSYFTNLVKCQQHNNRIPDDDEINSCCVYLDSEIKLIEPEIVVAVGVVAARYLTFTPSDRSFSILSNAGRIIKMVRYNVFIMPHPAYVLRNPSYIIKYRELWKKLKLIYEAIGPTQTKLF